MKIFDLDKTIISKDTELEFFFFLYKKKKIKKKYFKKSIKFYNEYENNTINIKKYFDFVIKIKKLSKKKIIKRFTKMVLYKSFYYKIIKIFNDSKFKIISTASFNFLVKYLCKKKLKCNHLFSTELKNKNVISNYGRKKLFNLIFWIIKKKKKFNNIFFYTDSISDESLVEFSSVSVLVNPNKKFMEKYYFKKNTYFLFVKTIC